MEDPMMFWSGFVFRKNSTWVKKLNEGIDLNLRFADVIYEQYMKQNNTKLCSKESVVKPLGFITVLGCFTWLFVGFATALSCLVLEHLFSKRRKGRKQALVFFLRATHAFLTRQQNYYYVEFGDFNFATAQRFNLDNRWFRNKENI
jgi:hypothetical protein